MHLTAREWGSRKCGATVDRSRKGGFRSTKPESPCSSVDRAAVSYTALFHPEILLIHGRRALSGRGFQSLGASAGLEPSTSPHHGSALHLVCPLSRFQQKATRVAVFDSAYGMSCSVDHGNSLARTGSRSPGHEASTGEGRRPRSFPYVVAVIEMPPRAFCLSVTRTLSVGSSSASARSSRILTASASQKCPSFR